MQRISHIFKSTQGSTMVELMAVLAIIGMWVAALLETIWSGMYFAKDVENNIKAINLAREGIEGMTNIRDTNWLRFSSDRRNCWRTKDYQWGCINSPTFSWLIGSGSYTIYPKNGAWYLSGITSPPSYTSNWASYANIFKVGLDSGGFWTQTGVVASPKCSSDVNVGCLTIFTREININVTGTGMMNVQSIVRWQGKRDRSVILETVLTNWKSNF